ncbi:hypothetical protein ACFWGC_26590 [Cytobacillus pseudoceanisediminis]|uniref:hypothetical protein n=1 Tax=Cytobacillus pseudoceanisediminis TaxID=3051614 RepID=UPI00365A84D2
MTKVNPSYQPNQDDVNIQEEEHPIIPGGKLIIIRIANKIGYAESETEAIQMIDELRNW